MTEHQFLIIKETTDIDVLNSDLYSYDSTVFSLTPTLQKRTSDSLIRRVERFVESVLALNKAADSVKAKFEYTPRLDLISDEIKQALKDGTAEIITCKDSKDAFFLQIRTTVKDLVVDGKEYGLHRKIKDIPLGQNKCLQMSQGLCSVYLCKIS